MAVKEKNNYTTIIFIGVVVVMFILLGIALANRWNKSSLTSFSYEVQQIKNQSENDSVDSIEKDLMETDLKEVDKELQDIDKEIELSYQ